jgi:hypothetical protein
MNFCQGRGHGDLAREEVMETCELNRLNYCRYILNGSYPRDGSTRDPDHATRKMVDTL